MRKSIFQGFSVFHSCGFYSVSAFLGTFFLAAIEKDAIFAIVKQTLSQRRYNTTIFKLLIFQDYG